MSVNKISLMHQPTALPPEYQAEREKAAILADPRLYEIIYDERVVAVLPREGGYMVMTDEGREVPVRVIYEHSGRIGPVKFRLEFGE